MARGREIRPLGVAVLQNPAKILQAVLPASHLKLGAHHRPDHTSEEAIGPDMIYPALSLRFPEGFHDMTYMGLGLAVPFGKASEVPVFHDHGRGGFQFPGIQREGIEIGPAMQKGVFSGIDPITVKATEGIEPGMKTGTGREENGLDTQGYREQSIEIIEEAGRHGLFQLHLKEIGIGMDSGIGTAGGQASDGMTGQSSQGLIQGFLHRRRVPLDLGTPEGGPLIADLQHINRHGN